MVKQVIVVRKDLGMRKGKIGSQVAHASLGAVLKHSYNDPLYYNGRIIEQRRSLPLSPEMKEWLDGPFTKIVLGCANLEELQGLKEAADKAKLLTCLITDAGKTEFNGVPTITCLAIGPAREEDIDPITGYLKPL